jgi:hypothetical protein
MKTTPEHDERMAKMTFASVYPHYISKVERKGRVKELHQVIEWLTGFDDKKLQELIDEKVTFKIFFQKAKLNPNTHQITGLICGYRVEEITNPLTQQIRYLDKLVDELARGKKMEKILRNAKNEWQDKKQHSYQQRFTVSRGVVLRLTVSSYNWTAVFQRNGSAEKPRLTANEKH